jgi:medium-chain acyl-[acyl-carrier-protein] hydrolase
MSTNWFLAPVRAQATAIRLFCLPYAGGSAAVYRGWSEPLSPLVSVHSVQLAGRGWRLREAPLADLETLADEVAGAIEATEAGPFAVFGHSMGAWLGLEVVRRLEAVGRPPLHFFASGRQAPSLGCTQPPLSHLSDDAFVTEVQARYGGIPAEIVQEPELLALLLPALRADIALLETYERPELAPIRTPIHALVGDRDSVVSVDEVLPWQSETAGGFELTTVPGGHFYFQPDPTPLLRVLEDQLAAFLPGARQEAVAS